MAKPPHVTQQQSKWFKSIQAGLEKETSKSLDDWIEIARACPESKHRARLNWFKKEHGLGINRASLILSATFKTGLGWDNPNALLDNLWKTPETRSVYDLIEITAKDIGDDVVIGARKNFSAFSRRVQFAALRPTRSAIRLGVSIPLEDAKDCIAPSSSDSWSDRLTAVRLINSVDDVDESITILLQNAYDLSG